MPLACAFHQALEEAERRANDDAASAEETVRISQAMAQTSRDNVARIALFKEELEMNEVFEKEAIIKPPAS